MTNTLPAHHKLGPSTAKRWLNCHGSVIAAASSNPPSKYAAEGTLAHYIAAEKLHMHFDGAKPKYSHAIGTKYWVSKDDSSLVTGVKNDKHEWFEFTITEEMLDAVDVYVDFCIAISQGVKREHVFIETRVKIRSELGDKYPEWALGGTADFIVVKTFDRIIVVDYKHGQGTYVPVEENEQGLSYALGTVHSVLSEFDFDQLETVEIVICQPRLYSGGAIRRWETTPERLTTFHAECLTAQHKIAIDKDQSRNAGDWCTFCPHENRCETQDKHIGGGLAIEIDDLEDIKLPVVKDFDIQQLVKIVEMESAINKYIKRAWEILEEKTKQGEDTGYEFVDKVARNRAWKLDETNTAKKLDDLGINAYTKDLVSPTEAEKRLVAALSITKAEAAKMVNEFTHKPITGKELVKKTISDAELLD